MAQILQWLRSCLGQRRNTQKDADRGRTTTGPRRHADHDYIAARQERYVETYRTANAKAMMEWMDPDDFVYSDFGMPGLGSL